VKQIPLVNSRSFAKVPDESFALLSLSRWRLEDGIAITELLDLYGITLEMGVLISNPVLAKGSHGAN
jgi:hypothetical protein